MCECGSAEIEVKSFYFPYLDFVLCCLYVDILNHKSPLSFSDIKTALMSCKIGAASLGLCWGSYGPLAAAAAVE